MSLIISNLKATEPRTLHKKAEASTTWFKRVVDSIRWIQQKVDFSLLLTCQLDEWEKH